MDFCGTFGTPEGKRVLEKLRSLTTYNKSSIRLDKEIDIDRLVYDEGQRAVIIYIDNQLSKNPNVEKQEESRS